MKNFFLALAASSALMAPVAQAAIFVPPVTTAVFTGPVAVEKDSGVFNCILTLTVDTGANFGGDGHGSWAHAHNATATAVLSDVSAPSVCPLILIDGTADVTAIEKPSGKTILTFDGFSIIPPISGGFCSGPIKAVWGGHASLTRSIEVKTPLSDMAGGCRMIGEVVQVSGTSLEIYGD